MNPGLLRDGRKYLLRTCLILQLIWAVFRRDSVDEICSCFQAACLLFRDASGGNECNRRTFQRWPNTFCKHFGDCFGCPLLFTPRWIGAFCLMKGLPPVTLRKRTKGPLPIRSASFPFPLLKMIFTRLAIACRWLLRLETRQKLSYNVGSARPLIPKDSDVTNGNTYNKPVWSKELWKACAAVSESGGSKTVSVTSLPRVAERSSKRTLLTRSNSCCQDIEKDEIVSYRRIRV